MIKNLLFAGLGGGLGSMLRFAIYLMIRTTGFPLATFLVNLLGSFLIGLIIAAGIEKQMSETWKIFLATGICGGFTTFSAFSIENIQLLQDGKYATSFLYILSSLLFGFAAAWVGYKCFR